jgi:hypothetical protein
MQIHFFVVILFFYDLPFCLFLFNQPTVPNYYLKWVTNDPILPIFLDKKIHLQNERNHDFTFRWYKYPQETYLDQIDPFNDFYYYSHTNKRTSLYILNYDHKSHDQLATYEPRDQRNANTVNDLYTLAYLESHFIDALIDKNDPNKINFFCNATVLLPNVNKFDLNFKNIKLVESHLRFKIGFGTNKKDKHLNQSSVNSDVKRYKRSSEQFIQVFISRF